MPYLIVTRFVDHTGVSCDSFQSDELTAFFRSDNRFGFNGCFKTQSDHFIKLTAGPVTVLNALENAGYSVIKMKVSTERPQYGATMTNTSQQYRLKQDLFTWILHRPHIPTKS